MEMSTAEAYATLRLPQDSSIDDVVLNFKQLALECHPDKHSQNEESFENFHKLCYAFQKLTKKDEKERKKPLTTKRMFHLFEEAFFGESAMDLNGYPYFNPDSGDDEDGDDSGDEELNGAAAVTTSQPNGYQNYDLDTEEKDKKKAAKRKAKKKKRKEKKKQEKEMNQQSDKKQTDEDNENVATISESDDDSKADEELDPNSAFALAITRNKSVTGNRNSKPEKFVSRENKDTNLSNEQNLADNDPVILRSRNLAIRGNEMASVNQFQDAVELFTEAIKLHPKDFRFYGNRSFCYDKLQQFEKALRDADKAIQLNPNWAKNYFRRGRALAGMKRFPEAEAAFAQVLKLDNNCEDAEQELLDVQIRQLMELGYNRPQASKALKENKTVQAAADSLLNSSVNLDNDDDVYLSDDDSQLVLGSKRIAAQKTRDIKMDPTNPEGLASLWIGNITKDVKEKTLKQLFSNCGTVTSLRLLPEKFCAFVNFSDKFAAGRAMQELQGVQCCGQRLLIKFPDKMGTNVPQNTYKKSLLKSTNTV